MNMFIYAVDTDTSADRSRARVITIQMLRPDSLDF